MGKNVFENLHIFVLFILSVCNGTLVYASLGKILFNVKHLKTQSSDFQFIYLAFSYSAFVFKKLVEELVVRHDHFCQCMEIFRLQFL